METTKEEREAWLRVEGVEPQASEGAFGRLIRDVDTLEEALEHSAKAAHYLAGHKGYFKNCSASDCHKARAVLAPKP